MDKYVHPPLYYVCDYFFMLELKLIKLVLVKGPLEV